MSIIPLRTKPKATHPIHYHSSQLQTSTSFPPRNPSTTNEIAKDPLQSIQRKLETIQVICRHRHNLDPAILLPAKTSSIEKMCEEAFGNCIDGCFSSIDKFCDETFGDALDRCCSLPCFGKENQEDYLKIRKAKKIATVKLQLERLQSPHPHDTDAMKEWRAKEIVKTKVELADLTGGEPPTVDPLQLPLLHEFELHELNVSITCSFSWAAFTLFMCG
jgi:hypothetical protein